MSAYRPLKSLLDTEAGCFACPWNRRTAFVALCASLALLGTGLACYSAIPCRPTVCVAVGYPNKFSASVSMVSVSIPLNVSVANPNYFGISLKQTKISLAYAHSASSHDAKPPITLSTVSAPRLHIMARGNSSSSFSAVMRSSSGTLPSDAGILRDCAASHRTTLYISVAATVFTWVHVVIPNQPITIKCSVSAFATIAKLVPDSQSHSKLYCSKP